MNELLQSIQQEAKDLFMRAKSIPDLIRRLQKIKDPQIRVHHTQDDTTKAIIINAWLQRFGLEQNFKALFNRKDFGNYYCKS